MVITVSQIMDNQNPSSRVLPLCQITAPDEASGLQKLKQMLEEEGIETRIYGEFWLRWKDTLFSVRRIGPPADLGRMLKAVRCLQEEEEKSKERYSSFMNMNP